MSRCLSLYIAGTDTGAGKTRAALALMRALQEQGLCVSGMKPVASGARQIQGRLRNEDALLLQEQSTPALAYELVNPYVFAPALSPHFAANLSGTAIDLEVIAGCAQRLQEQSQALIIEGVGGWRVPWGDALEAAHLVHRLTTPVILVVGLRLGCINHALLTAEAMQRDGVSMAGWIASHLEANYAGADLTLADLRARLPAPLLGELPWQPGAGPGTVAQALELQPLYRAFGLALPEAEGKTCI